MAGTLECARSESSGCRVRGLFQRNCEAIEAFPTIIIIIIITITII